MGDLWDDDGFGKSGAAREAGADDGDEGDERLDTSVEGGFDDPDAVEEGGWDEEEAED